MDCRQIGAMGERYDAVICGFCLPYLSKEEALQLISDVAGILNENGVFYISTMEDDYEKSDWKKSSSGKYETFTHYHQADYLTAALLANGFDIVDLRRKDYPEANGGFSKDLLILSSKR